VENDTASEFTAIRLSKSEFVMKLTSQHITQLVVTQNNYMTITVKKIFSKISD